MMSDNRRNGISLFLFMLIVYLRFSNGCEITGIGGTIYETLILDTFRGNIYDNATSGISAVTVVQAPELNAGPYFDIFLSDDFNLVIRTNDAFENYEENETQQIVRFTLGFTCPVPRQVAFFIFITDTNNHHPEFLPSNEFHFTVPTPLPSGFLITGCNSGITVRDIDLTTASIIFIITENPYFEIVYDHELSAAAPPKEFIGVLRTKSFVRSLPDTVILEVTATDVDLTDDEPLSATATITIKSDTVHLPEDPIFAQPFYLATYTDNHQVILVETISLQSGFDEKLLHFDLEGDYAHNFKLNPNRDQVTIETLTELEPDVLRKKQIILVVRAIKENTSGDTTTVIVQLPEEETLQFQRTHYEGIVENGRLQLQQLILTQGYEGQDVNVNILGEHADYFVPDIEENVITLSTKELSDTVINDNNVISITVEAFTDFSSAITVVTLEIIKDDNVTPVFNKPIYIGSYATETGLDLENIVLDQGFGEGVGFYLDGDHEDLFQINDEGHIVTLSVKTSIPPEIFDEQRILLTLQATKSRTVGANTAIIINLPEGKEVKFDKIIYKGQIERHDVNHETIILSNYEGNEVEILGDFSEFFEARALDGKVTVVASDTLNLPINVRRVVLELHAADARTVLLLDVDQPDPDTGNDVTFDKLIYEGHIHFNDVIHDTITISNYEGDEIGIRGDFSTLFVARSVDGRVTVVARDSVTLPNDVSRIVLELYAADARAVLVLDVDQSDLQTGVAFGKHAYEGYIEEGYIRHEPITITNYDGDIVWVRGVHSSLFEARAVNGDVTVVARGLLILPDGVTRFILELHAADASTVLVLEVVPSDTGTGNDVTFDKLIYEGHIHVNDVIHDTITISNYEGDEIGIRGDFSTLFVARSVDGRVTVVARDSVTLPNDVSRIVLELYAADARAVLVLDVDQSDLQTGVAFGKHAYEGYIEEGYIRHEPITITNYDGDIVWVRGVHSSLFEARAVNGDVTVVARGLLILPDGVTRFILELHAADASTVLVLEVVPSDTGTGNDVTFDKLIYEGHIHVNDVIHDTITISNYEGDEIGIRGDFSTLFVARSVDGRVTVVARDSVTLPNDVSRIVLELYAADARAVLVLDVDQSDLQTGVAFGKHAYEGYIEEGYIRHEPITITNYDGDIVWVRGVHSSLFEARAVNGDVTVVARGLLILPDGVTRFILELHAADASTVLVLEVVPSDTGTGNDVTFDKLIYEGHIHVNDVIHDTITISNYEGDEIGIRGDFSTLFVARSVDGRVTVVARDSVTLPNDVSRIVLELYAADARAVLVLDVDQSDLQTGVAFGKHAYEGYIEEGYIRHEPITITNYDGDIVWVRGVHSSLFEARAVNGDVTVVARGLLILPDGVTRFILELHAADASTVLVLEVVPSDTGTGNDVTFDKLIYEGHIHVNDVIHDTITISNYEGDEIGIRGDFSTLFVARSVDGRVTVVARDSVTLPNDVSRIVLELYAADARAVLVLDVDQSDLQTGVAFGKHAYEGYIEEGYIRHEPITITNYDGDIVWVRGVHSSLFEARAVNGDVTVVARGLLILPDGVTRFILELHAADASTVLVLEVVPSDTGTGNDVTFDKLIYEGHIHVNDVIHDTITISNYEGDEIGIRGDFSTLFVARSVDGRVTVVARDSVTLPNDVSRIVLELYAADARAVLVLDVDQSDLQTGVAFGKHAYEGYIEEGYIRHEPITITNYDGDIVWVRGVHSSLFEARAVNGDVTVVARGLLILPDGVTRFILELHAADASTVLVLEVVPSDTGTGNDVTFDKLIYEGHIHVNDVIHDTITISNYEGDEIGIRGDFSTLFVARSVDGRVTVVARDSVTLPNDVSRIVLELYAADARAVLVLDVDQSDLQTGVAFGKHAYEGYIEEGYIRHEPITITNYDGDIVWVRGVHSSLFEARAVNGDVTVVARGLLILPDGVTRFILELYAADASTVLVLEVVPSDTGTGNDVTFDKLIYEGHIHVNDVIHDTITISNYEGDEIGIRGDFSTLFVARSVDGRVTVVARDSVTLPNDVSRIVLELYAADARAVLVLDVDQSDLQTGVAFGKHAYEGYIEEGYIRHEPITITNYDGDIVWVRGEHSSLFEARAVNGDVTVVARGPLILPDGVTRFILELHAADASTVLVLEVVPSDIEPGDQVLFNKLIYEGYVHGDFVLHEDIILSNYNGNYVGLHGEYSSLFVARFVSGVVTVTSVGPLGLPPTVERVVLELHAADARAVLFLDVHPSDATIQPEVTFSSPSYVVNVDVTQTGRVSQVEATADNGETVLYSLTVNDDHLRARVSINRDGELFLSAPANSGVHIFQVTATTFITRAQGTAMVHLTVQAITIIDDKIVVPPLIILNRDEEQPHNDLVLLNSPEFEGCHFDITNRWPLDQEWLFVDESGLHATSIDRENESIAFMALSQIQVELILHCGSDSETRTKRSSRTDWLGPYDYGANQWILTESIPYNSRRSLVNLIVNDINDNSPIFIGKEHEPIAIGYPNTEIEEAILPRSLAELQATDADIGENAALLYWSIEDTLAVSPITGFVHVRSGATLQNDQRLTVSATDRNGAGLTGSIELLVKILHTNNIAVMTVRNAFLENEFSILAEISEAVGYEVKTLKSVVISDNENSSNVMRKLRDTNTSGASLQLFVYGLLQREPVIAERLIEDVNNNAVVTYVISTVSLEDHLVPTGERDIGLLIATIILSSLLFILTVLIGIWFFFKWRKNRKYDQFSDTKSLASSTSRESIIEIKNLEATKPRLNIEELKKSEKRLQDRLSTPAEAVNVEPTNVKNQIPAESIVDLLSPESNTPIVIQSIDKLKDSDDTDVDDFGEKAGPRRKSVVTFNENVEKIIHVENDTDSISTTSDFEVYKF